MSKTYSQHLIIVGNGSKMPFRYRRRSRKSNSVGTALVSVAATNCKIKTK